MINSLKVKALNLICENLNYRDFPLQEKVPSLVIADYITYMLLIASMIVFLIT
jgi:hypothetical protein